MMFGHDVLLVYIIFSLDNYFQEGGKNEKEGGKQGRREDGWKEEKKCSFSLNSSE